ncbi:MAG: AAA family ATPase [Prevotella sp.]|nr:AAA family ATPase [Prevotella sp.]
MEHLTDNYRKLLSETPTDFHRYIYDKVNWSDRMVGITGPRGVGKTTLLLQYIKEKLNTDDTLYVTAEDFYFSNHRLTELADEFTKMGGRHLFIDEIHKHEDWSRELKLIYDYHKELQVVFTGSSVLDITKGATADLSRRAITYNMQGLSWREYLKLFHNIEIPQYTLDDILQQKVSLPQGFRPLALFREYLRKGYYPFAGESNYEKRLFAVITKTLEVDIPQYANLSASMSRKLRHLLAVIAESVPFKPNMTSLAQVLGVSRNNVADYLLLMEEAGMIGQLRDSTSGIRGLGKVNKVYLDNPNLIYTLVPEKAETGNVRETFFYNQMRVNNEVICSPVSDFLINGHTFEVGGKGKGKKQIADLPDSYVVKDDIEYGYGNVIPLWAFGLNY